MKQVLVYGMTNNPGGIENYLLNFFHRVQGKAVRLDFVSDFPAIGGAEQLMARGARLHFIPAKSRDLWGHLRGIWRILKDHPEYETVYFNILDAGAAVTMLPVFLLGRKIVVHSHNGSTDKILLHRLCRPMLKRITSRRVACSGIAAEHMFGTGKNVLVIHNTIDASKYAYREDVRSRKRRELGLAVEPVIIHVGRLSRQKNPLGLIDIFHEIHTLRPDAVLLSVGGGEMTEEFTAYIRQKRLEGAVKCLGIRRDVAELLQAGDVFLLPSLYEGLPISLLEAQAAGLPCVISDTISRETVVTDLVRRVPLTAPCRVWAEVVLEGLGRDRENTLQALVRRGFDSSGCERFDEKLIELF